jgi:hypothetical protein
VSIMQSPPPLTSHRQSQRIDSHRVWTDTVQRRDEARTLLNTLLEAKYVSERNLAQINRHDMIKRVTGKSSMDNAIASTKRLIDSFDRVLVELKASLSDEDLALLDEIQAAV